MQRARGLPGRATSPEGVYELVKRHGMDFVTITDHDRIAGVLDIADRPDGFTSGQPQGRNSSCRPAPLARFERPAPFEGQRHSVGLGGLEIEVKRTLRLAFGHFGWRSLAAQARRERRSLEELLSRGAAYLGSELGGGGGALRVPRAGGQRHGRDSGIELALPGIELALPPAIWRDLGAEAARQQVALGRLLEHAALRYLAAVDSAQRTDAERHRGTRTTLNFHGRRPGADRHARR
jgi:hypothetical protein